MAFKLLGFLDLPSWRAFEDNMFTKIEKEVGLAERLVRELAIEDALQQEIKATLEFQGKSYKEWQQQPATEREKVRLTVCYDMGWQKKGTGKNYDSASGHSFIVGAHT